MYICACVYAPQHLKLLAFIACLPENSLSLENRTLKSVTGLLGCNPSFDCRLPSLFCEIGLSPCILTTSPSIFPNSLWCFCLQLEDFVGAHAEYNEEEEERKYFRRKRLGVIKNLLAASIAGMLTYGVFLGRYCRSYHPLLLPYNHLFICSFIVRQIYKAVHLPEESWMAKKNKSTTQISQSA